MEVLSVEDGLSENITHAIMQDRKGFIWIGASQGLNRYDGNEFVVFRHNENDTFSLSSGGVNSMLEDKAGRMWVATRDNGLNYFDREYRRFYHFLQGTRLLQIKEDAAGTLYVNTADKVICLRIKPATPGARGGAPFAVSTYTFPFVPFFRQSRGGRGSRLFSDNRKNVYATQRDGLYALRFDTAAGRLYAEKLYGYNGATVPPPLAQDGRTGRYYLSTPAGILESNNSRFTNPTKIRGPLKNPQIMFIDHRSRLWYVHHRDNHVFDLLTHEDKKVVLSDGNPKLQSGRLRPEMVDNGGTIWMLAYKAGVAKYADDDNKIRTLLRGTHVNSILNSNDSEILVNSTYLIRFGRKGISINDAGNKKKTGFLNAAWTRDGKGNFWCYRAGAIIQQNPSTGFRKRIAVPWKQFDTRTVPAVTVGNGRRRTTAVSTIAPESIHADRESCLWLRCDTGFVYYDTQAQTFHYINRGTGHRIWYEDAEGLMWMRVDNGLCTHDKKTGETKLIYFTPGGGPHTLPGDGITGFCDDPLQPRNYIWMGTQNGLCRMDKKTGACRTFTTKDGLPDNAIFNLLRDDEGDIWFTAGRGITRLHPADCSFRNFTVGDGRQSEAFNGATGTRLKDGTLVFGGLNGIAYFNPKEIRPLPPPATIITDCSVCGKSLNLDTAATGGKDVAYAKDISVGYRNNVISFSFAGTDYRKTHALRYRYKLMPFDTGWNHSGTAHTATYTNLDPGEYTFVAEASNTNGIWGKESGSVGLRVLPLWWQTWWCKAFTAAALLSLLLLLHRYRLQQVLKIERVRNNIARDLHDEIGSTLSTISIYSAIAERYRNKPEANPYPLMEKINENAGKVMEAMNDIVWSINTKNDKFENIVHRMQEHAVHLLKLKGYAVHFRFDACLDQKIFGFEKRKNLYLIYKEALNNIAKYADGKNVWIHIRDNKSSLTLIVKDDGKGFRVGSNGTAGGNGLANMQSRAVSIGGGVTVTSEIGQGTEIRVEIPYR